MEHRPDKKTAAGSGPFDIDRLLHPANAFAHPMDVLNDPDLTRNEKRAVLASWAADACAAETAPALRSPPGATVVRFDDIMDALKELDRQRSRAKPHYRRVLENRVPGVFGRNDDGHAGGQGPALN